MSNYFDLQNGPILTTPSSITVPKISTIGYPGDDTAADPAGGQTITLTGAGFEAGASVIINGNAVGVVSVVSNTTITFTSPANSAGSYVLYVVNTDGGTAVAVPGIQYSGVPNWTTAAGSLGSYTETVAIANTVTATGDAPITYSLFSGSLPTGATLNSANGYISGTSPLAASPTTYTFTIRATDAQQQDTNRSFSLTINPDVVTWSSPANGTTYTSVANSAISNVALSATAASGKSITYTANALPTGLSISGSNITGTPTVVANSSTLLTATANTTNATATRTINWIINVASDAFFPYVTSLLSANTPASTFVADASTNNFNVVAYNDARPSNFGPYTPGYYSNYFDGTGDYLRVANNAALELGSSDFTIEFWINWVSFQANKTILTKGYGTIYAPFLFYADVGAAFNIYMSSAGSSFNIANGLSIIPSVVNGTWYHCVLTRSGSNFATYVNGVRSATFTSSSALFPAPTYDLTIAASIHNLGDNPNCYISNLRIVKGTAVYDPTQTTITVPTAPLTAVANTSLLTCQSNRFIDNSTNNFTITRNGDTLVSGFDPFVPSGSFAGLGSGYFDGSGDYLDTPSSSAFVLGSSGNFTIECWIYPIGTQSAYAIVVSTYTDFNATGGYLNKWNLGFSTTTVLTWYDSTGNAGINSSNFPINVWSHVAVVRNGGTITMYVNGVSVGTQTSSQDYTSQSPVRVGLVPSAATFNGYISNLRIVKGTAVYTANFTPPTTSLTAITNTQLLILQNNQPNNNSMFLDNSTSNFNITRNGNTTQGSFSPYGGGWSNYFDGTGDDLRVSSNAAFALGTGDFTFEMWINPPSWAASAPIFVVSGTGGIWIGKNGSNFVVRAYGVADQLSYATMPTVNTWTHVVAVRSGTTLSMYFNGVRVATTTNSYNFAQSYVAIGSDGEPTNPTYYTGYISNLRLVKGTAVYNPTQTTLTVPTAPLTPIANTGLLTCADNRFIDDSINNFAITRNGDTSIQRFNPFNPVLTTPTSYSGFFDGTGDYLSVSSFGLSQQLNALGTGGDFTVEAWIYPARTSWSGYSDVFLVGTTGMLTLDGKLVAYGFTGTPTSGTVMSLNAWTHIAISRSSGTLRGFQNGVQVFSVANSTQWPTNQGVLMGAWSGGTSEFWQGFISNLRVSNNARYTGAFTPSTAPLTADANTLFLTCQSATFVDNSANNYTITAVGDTVPRQFNPFGWTNTTGSSAAYTPALYSGSAYFDGSGDYLSFTGGSATAIGTSSGTVEFWMYATANDGYRRIICSTSGGFSSGTFVIRFNLGNFLVGAGTNNITTTLPIINRWYHIAWVGLNGSSQTLYIDGVAVGTATSYNLTESISLIGGWYSVNTSEFFAGYLSDVRIIKGRALYTSNFQPPIAPLTAIPNTTLLNNMTSAAIYDSAMLTNYETLGNAGVVTSLKKYGNSSLYFDGTGDYLPAQTSPNFAFGTGDFTVEAWIYSADVSFAAQRGFIQTSATVGGLSTSYTSGIIILFGGSSFGSINANVGGSNYNSGGSTVATNTWYHVALTRASGVVNLWLNGVSVASGSGNTANLTGQNLVVGGYYSTGYLYNGYLDDVRITRGIARYTSAFTPPSTPVFTN